MAISDFYIRLKVALDTGQFPPDVIDRLKFGLDEFEASNYKKPLCICLGIRGPGQNSLGTVAARKIRDRYLQQAWRLVAIDAYLDDWSRSKRLLESIHKFESMTWSRVKAYQDPPERLDPLQKLLFKAFATGIDMPTSAKQINRIAMDMKQGLLMSMTINND